MTWTRGRIALCSLVAVGVIGSAAGIRMTGDGDAPAQLEPTPQLDRAATGASLPLEEPAPPEEPQPSVGFDDAADLATPASVDPSAASGASRSAAAGSATVLLRVKASDGVPVRIQALVPKPPTFTPCSSRTADLVASAETTGSRVVAIRIPAGVDLAFFASGPGDDVPRSVDGVRALSSGQESRLDLEFPAERPLFHGIVVVRETGEPIGGARIRDVEHGDGCLSATSSSDGSFTLQAGPLGELQADVDASGFARARFRVDAEHGDPREPKKIELVAPSALAFHVHRPDGSPVSGVELRVLALDEFYSSMVTLSAATDDAGRCEIPDLPSRAFSLHVDVYRDGRLVREGPRLDGLAGGERRSVDIVLSPGARVNGRLVDQRGEPLAGIAVGIAPGIEGRRSYWSSSTVVSQQTITASEGGFTFREVLPGDWQIGPLVPEDDSTKDLAPVAQPVTITSSQSEVELVVVAYRGMSITGRVVQPDGNPAADVFVSNSGTQLMTRSDAEGRFTLRPAWDEEIEIDTLPRATTPVRVRPGAAPVTLRLRPAGELSGKIMDARGKPVSGFIRTCSLTQGSCEEKRSRPSGRFNLEGLPPDRYDVIAWTDGGAVGALRNVRVDAGRVVEGLRIQVDPGAVLELEAAEPLLDLRVLDAAGRKVCDFTSLMAGTRFSCVVEPGVWLAQRCDEEVVLQEVKVTLRTGERRKIVLGAP